MKILTDFHHGSLMTATTMLGERLGATVHRPIGMEWYEQGYWAINDLEATARQFLDIGSQPMDGTAPLNEMASGDNGLHSVLDPGGLTSHLAVTWERFLQTSYDVIMPSCPQHFELFKRLRDKYQPQAKLIMQVGNEEWPLEWFAGTPVLASVKPRFLPNQNICWYRQEFDTEIFRYEPFRVPRPLRKITSYVNVLREQPHSWSDYELLKEEGLNAQAQIHVFSKGGQCPDGNCTGPAELAADMRSSAAILHSKQQGDGYGHVIHNAFCIGRPVIARPSQYVNRLAGELMVPGAFFNLDRMTPADIINDVAHLSTEGLRQMGEEAARRFKEVVDFEDIAEQVGDWISTL